MRWEDLCEGKVVDYGSKNYFLECEGGMSDPYKRAITKMGVESWGGVWGLDYCASKRLKWRW